MTYVQERLEYLRGELRAGNMSYQELDELQAMAKDIDPSDNELLEAAGVPENLEQMKHTPGQIGRTLCRAGFHRWGIAWHYGYLTGEKARYQHCKYCGKSRPVIAKVKP